MDAILKKIRTLVQEIVETDDASSRFEIEEEINILIRKLQKELEKRN